MVTKMTNKEMLSALVDGEVIDQALIQDVEADAALQESWLSYHLIGDTLRGESPTQMNQASIALNVMNALEDEATYGATSKLEQEKLSQVKVEPLLESQPTPKEAKRKMPAWLGHLTQFGVAACVSLIAVFGVQQYSSSSSNTTAEADQTPVLQTIPLSGSAQPVSLTRESVRAQSKEAKEMEQRRQLNALMQDYELQLRLGRNNQQ